MPRMLLESAAGCLVCLLALPASAYSSPPRRDVEQAFRHPYRIGNPQLCEPTRWTFGTRGRTARRPCWANVWTCRPSDQSHALSGRKTVGFGPIFPSNFQSRRDVEH